MFLTNLRLLQDSHCHGDGGYAGMRQKYLKSFSQTAPEALSKVPLQIHEIKDRCSTDFITSHKKS